ncbi:hypothetical protein MHK_005532, partial [Candidatus Magnetomorum sp. HK-1]
SNTNAHKVSVFAWVEGDTVYTESKFSGGKKVKNAPIEVFDPNGNKIIGGTTNENGEFSFKISKKMEMKIVLIAGMGHKAYWVLPIEEFTEESTNFIEDKKKQKLITESPPKKLHTSECVTSEDVQQIVENVLDKKMKPLINKINKSLDPNHTPKFSDILGGIGYILGLIGIGAYYNYRNKIKGIK